MHTCIALRNEELAGSVFEIKLFITFLQYHCNILIALEGTVSCPNFANYFNIRYFTVYIQWSSLLE